MAKEIVSGLPLYLSVPEGALDRYDRSTFAADYAIGNSPWLAAPNEDNPISRATTRFERDRVDQASSAGETSLANWWLRSATSWHRGAGITFYDGDESDLHRFEDSHNVDVWTEGHLSLLPAMDQPYTAAAATYPESCSSGTWFIADGKLYILETDEDVVHVSALATAPTALTTDGNSAFVATAAALYRVKSDYTATKLYDAPGGAWTVQAIGYVKDRLIVCAQITDAKPMRVFELSRNPTTTVIDLVADSIYEFDLSTLSFTAVAETSAAILVSTTLGSRSTVLSFGLDTTTTPGVVALAAPVTTVALPTGEIIYAMRSYLNSYVVLGTNRGLRVGEETQSGTGFVYGPLVLEDTVRWLAFDGNYVYATRSASKSGVKGLWRVDLSTPVGDTYAYASDVSTSASEPSGVSTLGTTGRLVATTADGVWLSSSTDLAESGWLESGAVRFGTTERKQVVSMLTRVSGPAGQAQFELAGHAGDVVSFLHTPSVSAQDSLLATQSDPDSEFRLTITLTRGSATQGPTVDEWQIRALPTPNRSRTITLPLMCFPQETDSLGNQRQSDPWVRLSALEALEEAGACVLFQDFATGEERVCVIQAIQYQQINAPSFREGFAGIINVQLQTVD